MAGRKVGVVVKLIVFFFLWVYSFIIRKRVSTYFAFEKWDKYTFWSSKNTYFHLRWMQNSAYVRRHIYLVTRGAKFSWVHDWWLRDLKFTRTVWNGFTCRVYGKHQFTSLVERSMRDTAMADHGSCRPVELVHNGAPCRENAHNTKHRRGGCWNESSSNDVAIHAFCYSPIG